MVSVTFSVPEEVKKGMEEFAWVNWSELAREEVLIQDKRGDLLKELEELTKESKLTDADCLRFAKSIKRKFVKHSEE